LAQSRQRQAIHAKLDDIEIATSEVFLKLAEGLKKLQEPRADQVKLVIQEVGVEIIDENRNPNES